MRKIFLTTLFFFALALSLMNANASEQSELHWSVCEKSSELILAKLGLKIKEVERRKVSYSDKWNADLENFTHHSEGLILRVREEAGAFKSTVKIKFENLPQISEEWESLVKCERDIYTTKESFFCSLSEETNSFSATQKSFVKAYREEPEWDLLQVHGPAANTVWKMKAQINIPKLELEEIVLKDGSSIFEISTRAAAEEAESEHQRITSWLLQRALQICEVQESKTRQVLESYKD